MLISSLPVWCYHCHHVVRPAHRCRHLRKATLVGAHIFQLCLAWKVSVRVDILLWAPRTRHHTCLDTRHNYNSDSGTDWADLILCQCVTVIWSSGHGQHVDIWCIPTFDTIPFIISTRDLDIELWRCRPTLSWCGLLYLNERHVAQICRSAFFQSIASHHPFPWWRYWICSTLLYRLIENVTLISSFFNSKVIGKVKLGLRCSIENCHLACYVLSWLERGMIEFLRRDRSVVPLCPALHHQLRDGLQERLPGHLVRGIIFVR